MSKDIVTIDQLESGAKFRFPNRQNSDIVYQKIHMHPDILQRIGPYHYGPNLVVMHRFWFMDTETMGIYYSHLTEVVERYEEKD